MRPADVQASWVDRLEGLKFPYTSAMNIPNTSWERRAAALWSAFDDLDAIEFVARIEALAAELPHGDAVALFERGAAQGVLGAFPGRSRPRTRSCVYQPCGAVAVPAKIPALTFPLCE